MSNTIEAKIISKYFLILTLINTVAAIFFTLPILVPTSGIPLIVGVFPGTWLLIGYFLFLIVAFFIFCVIWVLLLGFAMPLLIFSGFVFGKWWGILIVLTSTTIGATFLYFLAGLFFRDIIKERFAPKFSKYTD